MRRLKPVEKRKPDEFRLLRCLGIEVNVVRFRKHVQRLQHRLYWDLGLRKVKLKARRVRRSHRLASH